jgi:O-Antigen ligase
LFRLLFLLATFVMLVNPKGLLHLDGNAGNVVQKLLIILTGAAFIATRPVHRGVVALICAIAVLTFVCALGTDFPGFQWRLYIGGLVSIVAPFVLLTAQPQARDRQLVLLVFGAMPVLMVLLGAVYQVAGIGHLITSDASGGARLSGTQDVPAFLAGAAFTGTFAALELAEQRSLRYAGLLLLDLIVLVLAGGRTPLALGVLVCGLAYLRSFRRVPLLKFFVPIWLLSFAVVAFVALRGLALEHLMSTSLSNRDLIWAVLRRHLDAHPWFGVGLGNQQLLMYEGLKARGAGTLAGHNEYLRLAVELGYPGAILFFLLNGAICLLVWNSAWVRRDPMFLVCVVAFYLYALTDNAFLASQIYFFLTVASFAGRGESAVPGEDRRHSPTVPSTLPGGQRPRNLSDLT